MQHQDREKRLKKGINGLTDSNNHLPQTKPSYATLKSESGVNGGLMATLFLK
jgi:hypothetical protein